MKASLGAGAVDLGAFGGRLRAPRSPRSSRWTPTKRRRQDRPARRQDQPGRVSAEETVIEDGPYKRQVVFYRTSAAPGTIVISTSERFLYLVLANNRALRYGIGVGRQGFQWSGMVTITRKTAWPDWTPPPEMIKRQPYLPRFMAGGPGNPMGARALYLGATVYRIHGTNQPETIGRRSLRAASGSPTATSPISSIARPSAPRSSFGKRRNSEGSDYARGKFLGPLAAAWWRPAPPRPARSTRSRQRGSVACGVSDRPAGLLRPRRQGRMERLRRRLLPRARGRRLRRPREGDLRPAQRQPSASTR